MTFIILRVLLLLSSSPLIFKHAESEQQRVVGIPIYNTVGGMRRYTCRYHNTGHCTWSKDEQPFDPTQYGYHYDNKNNCSIKSNNPSIYELRGISCVRFISYAIINAVLNQSVELNCHWLMNRNCTWKRNNAIVAIYGRYSPASNLTNSKNCFIRINNLNYIDYGIWTCSGQTTDNQNTEIIEAFVVSKPKNVTETYGEVSSQNNSFVNNTAGTWTTGHKLSQRLNRSASSRDEATTAESISKTIELVHLNSAITTESPTSTKSGTSETSTGETTSRDYYSNTIIAFGVGTSALIGIIIGLVCNKRCPRKLPFPTETLSPPEMRLPVLSTLTVPIRNQTEDANGYLIPTKLFRDKQRRETTSSDDVSEHIYEDIDSTHSN